MIHLVEVLVRGSSCYNPQALCGACNQPTAFLFTIYDSRFTAFSWAIVIRPLRDSIAYDEVGKTNPS
jgi:hypothetical protein